MNQRNQILEKIQKSRPNPNLQFEYKFKFESVILTQNKEIAGHDVK